MTAAPAVPYLTPQQVFWHGSAGASPTTCAANGPTITGVCDTDGWTVFSPGTVANSHAFVEGITACGGASASTTCIFYVRAAGSDAADCTFAAPCATAQHCINQMRNNSPDWCLLAKGDTWTNAGMFVNTSRNGLSNTSPSLISSYDPAASHNPPTPDPTTGGARPQLLFDSTWYVGLGNGEAYNVRAGHNAIVGIDFYAYKRDPANASYSTSESQLAAAAITGDWFSNIDGFLMEDCRFSFFSGSSVNSIFYSYPTNVFFRRNEILTNYTNANGTAQGILLSPFGSGFYYYENMMDNSAYNTGDSITWAPSDGRNHQIYLSPHFINGEAYSSFTAPVNWSSNIFSNVQPSEQFRAAGTFQNNLFVQEAYTIGQQNSSNNTSFATSITGNVWVNSLTAPLFAGTSFSGPQNYQAIDITSLQEDGTFPISTNSLTLASNFAVNSPNDLSGSGGYNFRDGVNAMTVKNNVLYNYSTNGNAYVKPSTSQLLTESVTTAGSGYGSNTMAISSATSCSTFDSGTFPVGTVGGNYICVVVANTANLGVSGWLMYNDGGGLKGPYSYSVRDSTHLALPGTTFSSNITGTIYIPYYGVALSCVSCANGGSATGATIDILVVSGAVQYAGQGGADFTNNGFVNVSGADYTAGDTLTAAAGTACNAVVPSALCTGGFGGGTGSGLVITVGSVTSNTFGASNNSGSCLTGTGNAIDPTGTNGCSFTDPARTAGGYYATLGGASANATCTGVVASSVLTLSGCSGSPIQPGDAVIWSGQTTKDYIRTYSGGVIATLGSITASACSASPAGCAAGTYNGVSLQGGHGYGLKANITVTGTTVTAATVSSGGQGYLTGDTFHVAATDIGGSSGGLANFSVPVSTFTHSGTACGGSACTGDGGNGTYVLTGLNTTVGSQSMSFYTAQQLINLTKGDPRTPTTGQYKGNWNNKLTACAVITWIKAGFGVTDTCDIHQ